MPHKRNPIRPSGSPASPGCCAATPRRARERRPLARARHLPLRRRAGDPARRDDRPRLHAAPRRPGSPSGMTVHTERMRENLELTHGALFSQRALTALVESGMTRDDAYRVVQENAQRAWDTGTAVPRAARRGGARPRPRRGLRLRRLPHPRARDLRAARSAASGTTRALGSRSMILYTCGQKKRGPAVRPSRARRPARRSTRPATTTRSRPSAATG